MVGYVRLTHIIIYIYIHYRYIYLYILYRYIPVSIHSIQIVKAKSGEEALVICAQYCCSSEGTKTVIQQH